MNKLLNPLVFSFVFLVLFTSENVLAGSEKSESIVLSWAPAVFPDGDSSSYIASLVLKGAIHADTLPEVPVFFSRKILPHHQYSHDFSIDNFTITKCSDLETQILESVNFTNSEFFQTTYRETSAGIDYSVFHLVPVRLHNGVYEKLVSFDLKYELKYKIEEKSAIQANYTENSVLAVGNWYRICVENEGIYRIGRPDLVELGLNPAQIDKSTLQLFGNGGGMLPESNAQPGITDLSENAIWVSGTGTTFSNDDFILFYGQSPNKWRYNAVNDAFVHEMHLYSTETCYFLTHGRETGKRIQQIAPSGQTPTHTITDFYDYRHHERELVNLLGSGKQWHGELFDVTNTRTFDFNFPNIVNQTARVVVNIAGRSSAATSFTIEGLGVSQNFGVAGVNMANSTGIFARTVDGRISGIPQSENISVKITYNRQATGSRGWLNFITVNASRNLIKTGDQMFFRNPSVVGQGNIARFEIRGISGNNTVWDITDALNIVSRPLELNGQTASFTVGSEILRQFVVFGDQSFPRPILRGIVANQNLHGLDVHDMVVIVPEIFRSEAERLAQFRREFDGLSVALVSPQQVYNEFSSGTPDIAAIRNFMKMFYHRRGVNGSFPVICFFLATELTIIRTCSGLAEI